MLGYISNSYSGNQILDVSVFENGGVGICSSESLCKPRNFTKMKEVDFQPASYAEFW